MLLLLLRLLRRNLVNPGDNNANWIESPLSYWNQPREERDVKYQKGFISRWNIKCDREKDRNEQICELHKQNKLSSEAQIPNDLHIHEGEVKKVLTTLAAKLVKVSLD